MADARYIMIGGFLGAGKTTAMLRLAHRLVADGRTVGLITNDQSTGLVDTALARANGLPVSEITGGCFCCRFQSLMDAATKLTRESAPDVFLAEPVGSCTDLRASVAYPLRRLYGDRFSVAPLSVLVDPVRTLRILGLENGKAFAPKVLYVYRKQLEEADIIVINKCDLLDQSRIEKLRVALVEQFPRAEVLTISALHSQGLDPWLARMLKGDLASFTAPDLDYVTYAEGEALLGWCNATIHLESEVPFDGNALLHQLTDEVRTRLAAADVEIAHFKMTLSPDEDAGDIGVINLVRGDADAFMAHTLAAELSGGELIVNLRAEGDPELLLDTLTTALTRMAAARHRLDVRFVHSERFRPPKPVPTYRMAEA